MRPQIRRHRLSLLVAVLAFATSCSSEDPSPLEESVRTTPTDADVTVVHNAVIYTVDKATSWAEAFAYDRDGNIIAVGTDDEVFAAAGQDAATIDADGRLVLPGFQDPHVHVPEAGINHGLCLWPAGRPLADYESLARDCAEEQHDTDWVRAAGPSLFGLRDTDELPIDLLDRAIPDRPALILDDLGHAVWTNSLGLEAAGITTDAIDPQGGILHRDADGRLTGLLLEDAQQLVRNAAATDDETNYEALLVALDELARNGVTTISDAGGYWGQNHPAAWSLAEGRGTLTVRAVNSLYVYPDLDVDEQLAEFEARFSDDPEAMLRFNTAKVYIDGILDLGTAALVTPYDVAVDEDYPSGFSYFQPDQLDTYTNELHQLGYRINFHVIGDGAARTALDAIETIDDKPDAIADRRHRLTHVFLVHADDVDRFAELGVVADFQLNPDAVDTGYHRYLTEFIGDRALDLIPTRTLVDANATVTLSSDWDAGPLSPFGTIERSLTRDTNPLPDVETAIALMTINAAYTLGHDNSTGSIEVGKQADYVIVDRNILEIDADKIDAAKIELTVVAGTEVYRRSGFTG
ncbi:MAG: amidohydrolase [Actinomycetia bacterium]|nr:amidohydrolase [Actinomycetes bacterium]MCP4962536.1 amidohydrolase [Actinomycetes bacterium]